MSHRALGRQFERVNHQDVDWGTRWGRKVEVSNYLPPIAPEDDQPDHFRETDEVREVPRHSFRSTQGYLDVPTAERFAAIPAEHWAKARPEDLPEVRLDQQGGAQVDDGHHRVVGALMRGDKTVRVRVTERETPSRGRRR